MAVINWLGANTPDKSGPEKYAPPNRRAPEKLSDIDQATADAVDGEIHEIIGRLRAEDAATVPTTVPTAENVNELIGRVSGASARSSTTRCPPLRPDRRCSPSTAEFINKLTCLA
jgi:hypothetical protein